MLDCEYSCGSLHLEVVKRLGELEDKIEQGELVENNVITYMNMARSSHKTLVEKAIKFDELKAKIEQGTLMEINKPFIKETAHGSYAICTASIIWLKDYKTKAEAEKKLQEFKEE